MYFNIENYIGMQVKSFIVLGVENVNGRNMVVLQCSDCGDIKKVRKTRFLNNEFADCACKSQPFEIGRKVNGFIVLGYTERYNRFAYVIGCTDCDRVYIVQKSQLENNRKLPKCICRGHKKKYRKVHKCDLLIGTFLEDRHLLITEKVRLDTGEIGVRLECTECGNTYDVDYRLITTGRYGFCSCDERYMRNKSEGAIKKYNELIGKTIGELFVKELHKDDYYFYICDCSCGRKDVKIDAHRLYNGLCYACPECHLSFGGSVIKEYLDNKGILFKTEVSFKELVGKETGRRYRYDFGVYSDNFNHLLCLIEFDGPQHNDPSYYISLGYSEEDAKNKVIENQIRDAEKDKFCEDNNIPLLRISYKRNKKYIIDILFNFLKEEGVI